MLKNAYSTSEPHQICLNLKNTVHVHTYHSLGNCNDVYLSFGSVHYDEHLEFGLAVVPEDE